jgi:hypothetical protein
MAERRTSGRDVYERATAFLSYVLIALGVAQIVTAAVRGSGAGAYLLGAVFIAVGSLRIWLAAQRRRAG